MKKLLTLLFGMLAATSFTFAQDGESEDAKLIKKKNYQEVDMAHNRREVVTVDRWAMYPNGKEGIQELVKKNMRYPEKLAKQNVKGVVILRYVIEDDGTIGDAEIIQGLHPTLDKEALRLVALMDKWIPAIRDGAPVRLWYALPIKFPSDYVAPVTAENQNE